MEPRPLQLEVAQVPSGLPASRNHTLGDTACLAVNDVGKPCAGDPQARFERGRWRSETDQAEMGEKATAQHPTPGTDDQPAAYLTTNGSTPYHAPIARV